MQRTAVDNQLGMDGFGVKLEPCERLGVVRFSCLQAIASWQLWGYVAAAIGSFAIVLMQHTAAAITYPL